MKRKPLCNALFTCEPIPVEVNSPDDAELFSSCMGAPSGRGLWFGTAGSLAFHALLGIALFLWAANGARREAPCSFVMVDLVRFESAPPPGPAEMSTPGLPAGETAPAVEERRTEIPKPEKSVVSSEPVKKKVIVKREHRQTVPPAGKQPSRPAPVASSESVSASSPNSVEKEEAAPISSTPTGAESTGPSPQSASDGSTGSGGARGTGNGGVDANSGIFDIRSVDQAPIAIQKREPAYPLSARQRGIVGEVLLKFLVGTDGRVANPSVLRSRPQGIFDRSALESLNHWKFKPGVHHGKAVSTWVVLPIVFQLSSGG